MELLFFIAETIGGATVAELSERMSSAELVGWEAYFRRKRAAQEDAMRDQRLQQQARQARGGNL